MAMINAQHEELGNVILNTETRKYVIGSIGGTLAEFIQFEGGQVLYRNAYDSHEAFMKDIEALHTDIVDELDADGYSVLFDA